MAINPKNLMAAKQRLNIFKSQHPKIIEYGKMLNEKAIEPGTVFEIKATTPEGQSYSANIRLTPEDVESFRMFKKK
ncbi:MAG: hypothetical protein SOI56_06925 [Eubacteriales bacterium]|jgi:hypothetical protein